MSTKQTEALKLALEALEIYWSKAEHRRTKEDDRKAEEAITAIREALAEQPAQQQQEPVAYRSRLASGDYTYCKTAQFFDNAEPLYTSPQPASNPLPPLTEFKLLNSIVEHNLHKDAEGYWTLRTSENEHIRYLSKYESDFVDSAIEAARGITGDHK